MPVLAVGTTNAGKVDAVRRALEVYSRLSAFEVRPAKVESGVSDQPASLEETTQGENYGDIRNHPMASGNARQQRKPNCC